MSIVQRNKSTLVYEGTEPEKLVRAIGRWSLAALIVNGVVGAGIFALPSAIAKLVGNAALYAYILGACITLVIVAVVVELSSQFQKPGGAYIYVREAFGSLAGIQTGWFSWLTRVTTAAAITNVLITSLVGFWPSIDRHAGIIVIISVLTLANIRGIKVGALVSNFFTIAKLLPLLALIGVGIMYWQHSTKPAEPLAATSLNQWIDALLAMVFAYSGFESAMIPGSELKNPRRDAPIAAFTALAVVTLLYVLLYVVVTHVVPDMAANDHPLATAAGIYGGAFGENLMSIAAIISTFGWLSAAIVSAPRLTYAMAQEHDFPAICGLVHPSYRTPWISILLWAGLVAALAIYGDFIWNAVLSVSARLIVYSTMCAAAIRLRITHPSRDAWRAPFGISLPIIGILFCLLLACRMKQDHLIMLALVSIAGFMTWIVKRNKRE